VRWAINRQPGSAGQRWRRSLIRLDATAAWINPFLVAIAALLLIADLSFGAALVIAQLPLIHITALPQAINRPPGLVFTAMQLG
jgi:hypothetical protein